MKMDKGRLKNTRMDRLISTREATTTMRRRSSATSNKSKNKRASSISRRNSQSEQLGASSNTAIIADLESSISRIEIEGLNDLLFNENMFANDARGDYDCDDGDDHVSDLSSVD